MGPVSREHRVGVRVDQARQNRLASAIYHFVHLILADPIDVIGRPQG